MPRPTPEQVNAARPLTIWAIRAAAAVLLATGAYLFLKRVLFGIGSGAGLPLR